MSTDREQRAKEIFADALERTDAAERAAFMTAACGDDAELKRRVEALLRAYDRAGWFLEESPAGDSVADAGVAAGPREKPGDRIGPYKLLEQIGEGGCGVVYMAEQVEPIRRRVALKVIKLGMDTRRVIARFEVERQALALMDHPNIARVLDAGATTAGRPYFVMELVRGVRLTEYCDSNNLSTAQRLELFMQVCHAIQHAHQKGIIHRDIKPSNILVTVVDGRPVPKVIDFGIAKAIDRPLTEKTLFTSFDQFVGTPAYMSPEQARLSGVDVDTRSDIYSLGVLLYELLTGHPPFDPKTLLAAGLDEMRRIIREQDPPRPSTRLSGLQQAEQTTVAKRRQSEPPKLIHQVRGDLDWIVMKCLEKERGRRYETADNVALDIGRHLRHEPVSAAAPGALYRGRKFVRRHKAGLAMAATVALLLVAGTVASVWGAVRANRARALAERHEAEARENLWNSYLTSARASRTGTRPGRRFAALDAAARAAGIRPSAELRGEAASALALVDIRTAREWKCRLPTPVEGIALDPRFERCATIEGPGKVSVRRLSDDRELLSLQTGLVPVGFSADGRFLALFRCGSLPRQIQVWDVDTAQRVLEIPQDQNCGMLDFHPTEPVVGICVSNRARFFDLRAGREWSWPLSGYEPFCVRFGPEGKQVALSSTTTGEVRVYEAESGALAATLVHSNGVRRVDWSPDGQWLAAPCADGSIGLWNMRLGGVLEAVLQGHTAVASSVSFDPQGEFLLSQGWDGTSALWSVATRNLVLRLPGSDPLVSFSADGRWLGPFATPQAARVLEVARAPACRVLPANIGNALGNGVISPDGRWIVIGGEGLQCWDSRNGRRLWTERAGPIRWVVFRPDGGALVTLAESGAQEWPWLADGLSANPRLGAPRRLAAGFGSQAEFSRDGSVLVASQVDGLWIRDTRTPEPVLLPMPRCNFSTVSPDGRWAAAAPWSYALEVRIWDLAGSKEVFRRTGASPVVAFTPNGRWMVMVWGDFYECLEVGTWRTLHHVPRDPAMVLRAAVSPDSRWLAVEHGGRGLLHVLEVPDFRPFMALDAASESAECFSPDGTLLLTRRAGGQFALWNLSRVREELTPLGLGW